MLLFGIPCCVWSLKCFLISRSSYRGWSLPYSVVIVFPGFVCVVAVGRAKVEQFVVVSGRTCEIRMMIKHVMYEESNSSKKA